MLKSLAGNEFTLGNRKDDKLYRLTDPFCRFFLTFIENNGGSGKQPEYRRRHGMERNNI